MRRTISSLALLGMLVATPAFAQQASSVSLYNRLGACYTPADTFPYKLNKSDPLYDAAREDHQRYLEELEDYVNCLDQERSSALQELRASFDLFLENFGKDAVLQYGAERGVDLSEWN